MPDHIHILIDATPNISPSKLVGELKRQSSLIIRNNNIIDNWQGWADGYYLESLSRNSLESVRQYIINQKPHHANHSYLEEYRDMLLATGVAEDDPEILLINDALRQHPIY